jgi:hypothetical protein
MIFRTENTRWAKIRKKVQFTEAKMHCLPKRLKSTFFEKNFFTPGPEVACRVKKNKSKDGFFNTNYSIFGPLEKQKQ